MGNRTDFDPDELSAHAMYKFLTAVVVPRPIAWVSSTSADGVDNLAPHSFFTGASSNPVFIAFVSVGRKDSLRNIEETGEFVVNLATEPMYEQINATGTNFPEDLGEFDMVGIEREPSTRVRPPRVAGSPAALECALHTTVRVGDSTTVFGRVVYAAVDSDMLDGNHPQVDMLRPLARLGRNEWSTIGEVREITRIRYADWPGHYVRD